MKRLITAFLWAALLAAPPAWAEQASPIEDGGSTSLLGSGSNGQDVLPVTEAFPFSAEKVAPDRIVARWDTLDGYYLYKEKIRFELVDSGNRIVEVQLPKGKVKDDPYFGRLEVYPHPVQAYITLAEPANPDLTLRAHYQGCAEQGLCYPPQKLDYPIEGGGAVAAGAAGAGGGSLFDAGQRELQSLLRSGSLWPILLGFFAAGLLLAFTACLYPMIPILSGIIAGDKDRGKGARAFLLSLVYVESTAITYALVGVIAGLTGEAVQADMQSPWVLGTFAALFVALALSMFGLYDLQLPAGWQTRINALSNRQSGGSYLGVAVMGVLSTLIVGACSGPALVAALAFISATGDAWLGGLALFVLANGMGLPLLLVGTAAGKLLPRAGHWMDTVKKVFGVLFLAVALWLVERVLPQALVVALWGMLAVAVGVFVGGFDQLAPGAGGLARLRKAGGLLLALWGALLLIGAAAGTSDVWQPLRPVTAPPAQRGPAPAAEDGFRKVASLDELNRVLARAEEAGRPVMVDVYADWCVYCVQLDERTFSQARVMEALEPFTLIKADVTAMTAEHKALLKELGVFLPPAVLFYGANGEERESMRVVGFMGPDEFVQRTRRVLSEG